MAKDPKYTAGLLKCSTDNMSYSSAVKVAQTTVKKEKK